MSQPHDSDRNIDSKAGGIRAAESPLGQQPLNEEGPHSSKRTSSRTGASMFVRVGAVLCTTLFISGLLLTLNPSSIFGFTAADPPSGQFLVFLMPLFGLLALTCILAWVIQANQ